MKLSALLAVLPLLWAAPAVAQPAMTSMSGTSSPAAAEPPIPDTPPPPPAKDHLADLYYDPSAMAASRHMMRMEMGATPFAKVMSNLAEYRFGPHGDGYRWDGQAWYGGDLNRLVLRSEGEGSVKDGLEAGEIQALYSRALSRYFDLQAGVRQDFAPRGRTYVTVGTQGLFPYWFDVEGALFISTTGDVLARAEGTYDLRLTQRLVLQPRAELNFAAQDTARTRTGAGLSNAELGLRLRYEIKREFAPYIGVSYDRRFGRTADYLRAAGEDPEVTSFVVGVRTWF
jgi:copper resistance protein B